MPQKECRAAIEKLYCYISNLGLVTVLMMQVGNPRQKNRTEKRMSCLPTSGHACIGKLPPLFQHGGFGDNTQIKSRWLQSLSDLYQFARFSFDLSTLPVFSLSQLLQIFSPSQARSHFCLPLSLSLSPKPTNHVSLS